MPDTPYSLITISALCLLVYGISVVLARYSIISVEWQRKFWNTLLLISFLVAGSIGLILAVTVNYKINFPITNILLVWHVDFGIALFLVSLFHFFHHINYYRTLFRKSERRQKGEENPSGGKLFINHENQQDFNLKRLPFSLGFIAMSTQLILIREFLSVFNGNELIIGIALANWMLLTATGVLVNRKTKQTTGLRGIMIGLLILAILPVVTLFLLYWLRNILMPVGSLPGIVHITLLISVFLAPFCLLSGWLYGAISLCLSSAFKKNAVSLTYGFETLGSIAAGILCSMILIFLFEPFQSFAIILIINSIIVFLTFNKDFYTTWKELYVYLAISVIIGVVALLANPDKRALQFIFPEQRIISYKDTPYGKLVVTEKEGQLNFFENYTLLFTTDNIISNEETVHYALLQRNFSGNVLLIGGSISGVAEECLKYPLHRVDCVELNPWILQFGRSFNRLPADPRFRYYAGDARMKIKKMLLEKSLLDLNGTQLNQKADSMSYDAILLNIPGPSTLQINRLYTYEFFRMCKKLLIEQGILSLGLMSTADYVGNDALIVQSTMYQTLKAVFKNVLVIPGEKNYFLASDGPLTPSVAMLSIKQSIENEYVNEFYLDDSSLQERSADIMKRISTDAPLNLDFEPVSCYRQLHYWLSYHVNFSFYLLLIPLILFLLFAAVRSPGTTIVLFSAGLSSFSLEIILLLTYQVIYGYVYLATGIFITLFMAGLAGGVFLARLYPDKTTYKTLVLLQILSGSIILLSIACIMLLKNFDLPTVLIHGIFCLLILTIALVTGAQFHIVTVMKTGDLQQIAASSYSAELVGSAAGAIIVNSWIVPYLGFITSLVIIGIVNTSVLLIMLIKKQT
jgi:spermidine synthase